MKFLNLILSFVIVFTVLFACSTQKVLQPGPENGVLLRYYDIPEENTLHYAMDNQFIQNMEIQGNPVRVTATEAKEFSIRSRCRVNQNHHLCLTIDSMELKVLSPHSNLQPDMNNVIGKRFDLILSQLGNELEVIGADSITYDLPTGQRCVANSFQGIFPDLPQNWIRTGESWKSMDTITEKTNLGQVKLVFLNNHTLDGFENVDGMDCVRIRNNFTGTITGVTQEKEMLFESNGTIEGTEIWFFAYKEGIFVSSSAEGVGKTITMATGPKELKIPATREFKISTRLTKSPVIL